MTEKTVRDAFFKNYSGGDLNEALMLTMEDVALAIIRECIENQESIPEEIVGTIAKAKSNIALFFGIKDGSNMSVPPRYLNYFDQIRKAMMDVSVYLRDNYESMSPWFKERFTKEQLALILTTRTYIIEMSAEVERSPNVRIFHLSELKINEAFLDSALVGIIGLEGFQKYLGEYNKCAVVLRQCQKECLVFGYKLRTKES